LRYYSPAFLLIVWEYQHNKKKHQLRIREVEKEKIATELKFLKSQINPHFLFNSFNNLYSFVVTESPLASDMLVRLTGIFEYAFEKGQQAEVILQLEVDTISDYIALERMRYGDRLEVRYESTGDMTLPVSPLIILSIIENAFKHGASGDINHPKIDIDIHTMDQKIHCRVWNTKSEYNGEINDAYKSGIGLSNI
jgi:two-component system LytT family sensor kinase